MTGGWAGLTKKCEGEFCAINKHQPPSRQSRHPSTLEGNLFGEIPGSPVPTGYASLAGWDPTGRPGMTLLFWRAAPASLCAGNVLLLSQTEQV
ncbi:MAG: hypothetical protein LBB23_02220 [Rickettsiales bacterium]|nr:hypothetical protein [Rickettsiales bacterium]